MTCFLYLDDEKIGSAVALMNDYVWRNTNAKIFFFIAQFTVLSLFLYKTFYPFESFFLIQMSIIFAVNIPAWKQIVQTLGKFMCYCPFTCSKLKQTMMLSQENSQSNFQF